MSIYHITILNRYGDEKGREVITHHNRRAAKKLSYIIHWHWQKKGAGLLKPEKIWDLATIYSI